MKARYMMWLGELLSLPLVVLLRMVLIILLLLVAAATAIDWG